MTLTRPTRTSTLLFAGVVMAVYATALTLAGLLPELERPGVLATGISLDLVVLVPLAFYALVLRRQGLPIAAIAPVLVLSLVAATFILPRDHHQMLRILEAVIVPLEFGLLGWVAWRAAQALRRMRHGAAGDPIEQLRRAAREVLPIDRAAEVVASEIALFYYALGAWRAEAHAPAGTHAFTHHQRSGHGGIVFALLVLAAAEGIAVHLLLDLWSTVAAWIFTLGTLYGALWLVADYRAVVLRPILVSDEEVWVRAGLRWSVRVPRARVAGVEREKPDYGNECLSLTLLGTPTHWMTLTEPVRVQGPYGFRRRARAFGFIPDAPQEFRRNLNATARRRGGEAAGAGAEGGSGVWPAGGAPS